VQGIENEEENAAAKDSSTTIWKIQIMNDLRTTRYRKRKADVNLISLNLIRNQIPNASNISISMPLPLNNIIEREPEVSSNIVELNEELERSVSSGSEPIVDTESRSFCLDLKQWSVSRHVTQSARKDLLEILRTHFIMEIPWHFT